MIYRCTKDEVISPSQYFARNGEKIFENNNSFCHVDRNNDVLYVDEGFDLSSIHNVAGEISENFTGAFKKMIMRNNCDFEKNSIVQIKKLTKETPIVIGGCGRSGTTLMLSILGAHSKIFAIPEETYAFYPNPLRLQRLSSQISELPTGVKWCEKTPKNILAYKKILNIFDDDVKIINMIRDGRDVITSKHPNGPGKYWVNKQRWIEDNQSLISNPNILTVKFEDLIRDPESTLLKVCNHIGLDFEIQLLNYQSKTNVLKNIAWKDTAKPIGLRNSLSHKRTEKDNKIIEDFMADPQALKLMNQFGYLR